ncbi:MAG: GAF domain-containing protein [Bacteroidales bacterium]|nr:GAF domain-containing protein [Bacteroidales bacterium]MBN2755637.1 GAF domain-containing protein [Bacteroidales bacterium]
MKLKFTIATKISFALGILLIFVILSSVSSYTTLQKNLRINREIVNYYLPASKSIAELALILTDSKMLIKNWVSTEKSNTKYKQKLTNLLQFEYPDLKNKIDELSKSWDQMEKNEYKTISLSIDTLFIEHKRIMELLKTPADYSKNINIAEAESKINDKGNILLLTDRILFKANILNNKFNKKIDASNVIMEASFNNFRELIRWSAVILFFIIIIIAFILTRTIVVPINSIKKLIIKMSNGELPKENIKYRFDEIGEMGHALNDLIKGLIKISKFSNEIGKENYTSEFEPLGENDELGNSLVLMRENLKKASEEAEIRKTENFQRSWASQGLAEFGELLRESKKDLEELTNEILAKLVRYLDANIGGLFIINDDNQENNFLELIAFYAYDRRKYVEKHINLGENLVGQCVMENETIFMTEIPDDYIEIASGLGKDKPTSLLIVPLKLNEKVYGVVELASVKKIEKYQIEFVEKIGESIASTISSAKISLHTAKLLQESNEKSERLTKQEQESKKQIEKLELDVETLKVNTESLKSKIKDQTEQFKDDIEYQKEANKDLNEELNFNKEEFKNILEAMNNSLGSYYLSNNGTFTSANDSYLKMTGKSMKELKGNKLEKFMADEDINSQDYQNLIPNLLSGHIYRKLNRYLFGKQEKWFHETFTPIYDSNGNFLRIICISKDMTETVNKENKLKEDYIIAQEEIKKLKSRLL